MAIPSTKSISAAVLRLQTILLDAGAPSSDHLLSAASLLSRGDYSDVVTERNISSLCGYPACGNTLLKKKEKERKREDARYRISLSEHKVYDLEERNKFCSENCLVSSKAYELSLSEKRSFDLSPDKIDRILKLFEEKEGGEIEELGLGFEKKEKKDLKIVEKEGGINNGEVKIEEWIGSAKSIEGYEPKYDFNNKGSKTGIMTYQQEMDFKSEIFFHDIFDQDISHNISRKLENTILNQKNNKKNNNNKKSIKNDLKIENKSHLKSSLKKNNTSSSSSFTLTNSRSVKFADNEPLQKSTGEKSTVDFRVESAEACIDGLIRASELISLNNTSPDKAVLEAGIVILPPKKEYSEDKKEYSSEDKKEYSLEEKKEYSLDSYEITKWPLKKPVLLETDAFDTDDNWHDSAPDGFSLKLSPFATIYMSIFSWTTNSTISFIYQNTPQKSKDQIVNLQNLQKYPSKVVLEDGQSGEIRRALDFFISHNISNLVSDLKITVPVSTLERNLGLLMDTMSFVEALPSLKSKQWRVIIILFFDALSLSSLSSLSPFLSDRNNILHKVLRPAQISEEEYDSLMNHFMPLGRN